MANNSVSGARPCVPCPSPVVHNESTDSLTAANRIGWKSFLACNSLYPRLATLAFCLFALIALAPAHAEPSLPAAPVPVSVQSAQYTADNTMTATDWALAGGLVLGRGLDWASTTECLRRPWCHEAELPSGLAHSKVGLGAFEAGMTGASILLQRYETRHGHRRIARTMAVFNLSVVGIVQVHNFRLVQQQQGAR
jgi:hypothetical protein